MAIGRRLVRIGSGRTIENGTENLRRIQNEGVGEEEEGKVRYNEMKENGEGRWRRVRKVNGGYVD